MKITDIIQTATAVGGFVISVITLLIIKRTLKENIDLNKRQYDLLKIEANRASREIRPEFDFRVEDTIGITLKDHQARNICTTCTVNLNSEIITEPAVFKDFLKPNEGILIAEGYERNSDDNISNWEVNISVAYQDEDGRNYIQRFKRFPPQRAFRGSYDETYPPVWID